MKSDNACSSSLPHITSLCSMCSTTATLRFLLVVVIGMTWLSRVHAAAIIQARHGGSGGSHDRGSRAAPCQKQLGHFPKRAATKFCLAYLHGRMPASASTVTVPASTTTVSTVPLTTSISTTVQQFIPPDETTTTTDTVATTTATETSPAAKRRRRTVETALVEKRSSLNQLHAQYSDEIITDACLLFLYGRLDASPTTTRPPTSTTTVTASSSTVYTTTTTTHTNAATSTTTVTISTTSGTTTTVPPPAPTMLVKAPGFEGLMQDSTNWNAYGPWTFSSEDGFVVDNVAGTAHSGNSEALHDFTVSVQQPLTGLQALKPYVASVYWAVYDKRDQTQCSFSLTLSNSADQSQSVNTFSSTVDYNTFNAMTDYIQITTPAFVPVGSQAVVSMTVSCSTPLTQTFFAQVLVDDVDVRLSS